MVQGYSNAFSNSFYDERECAILCQKTPLSHLFIFCLIFSYVICNALGATQPNFCSICYPFFYYASHPPLFLLVNHFYDIFYLIYSRIHLVFSFSQSFQSFFFFGLFPSYYLHFCVRHSHVIAGTMPPLYILRFNYLGTPHFIIPLLFIKLSSFYIISFYFRGLITCSDNYVFWDYFHFFIFPFMMF